jgi:hypothetical protein
MFFAGGGFGGNCGADGPERRQGDKINQYTLWLPRGAPPCTCSYHACCQSDNLDLCRKSALVRGFASPCSVWGPGGAWGGGSAFGESGGRALWAMYVFSSPPKELNASQMQPALECNQVSAGASCRMQTAVEGLSAGGCVP